MIRFLIPATLVLAACSMEQDVTDAEGKVFFIDNCAACHGADARGGGPLATGLSPKPTDLTRLSANNGGVFPRDHALSIIDGYRRGNHFSDVMPAFGDADLGDPITVEADDGSTTAIPAQLLALAEYLQTIQE